MHAPEPSMNTFSCTGAGAASNPAVVPCTISVSPHPAAMGPSHDPVRDAGGAVGSTTWEREGGK